jgi:hypothetical protein
VPWGGGVGFTGGIASAGENINTSSPAGNGWEGRFNNSGTRPDDSFRVDAICAKKPAGYTTTFTTVDNPSGRPVRRGRGVPGRYAAFERRHAVHR